MGTDRHPPLNDILVRFQRVARRWGGVPLLCSITILGSISVLALVAGGTVGLAAWLQLDWRLDGISVRLRANLPKEGGVLSYRQPVDKFAQAAIIEPQQILAPASACRVLAVAHVKDALSLTVECKDSVSFLTQSVQIKVRSNVEIVFSPNGDQALATTLVKCQL